MVQLHSFPPFYRGVAQMGARDIWDVEAAGSSPVTPTSKAAKAFADTANLDMGMGSVDQN